MLNPAQNNHEVTSNGIEVKFNPARNWLTISRPDQTNGFFVIEDTGCGWGEIHTTTQEIAELGEQLGGKSKADMEDAFSFVARDSFDRVIFSIDAPI